MKILVLSDEVVKGIYRSTIRERFADVEMVLSCGDLPYSYLEFVATMLHVPCFYVHGNHDHAEYTSDGRTLHAPGGWINLHGQTARSKGLLLAGLEGSNRYHPNSPYQYTQAEMRRQVYWLAPKLWLNRFRYGRYLDILITHSPPAGIHDDVDLPHRGFHSFLSLMRRYRPRFLFHGHKHVYGPESQQTLYEDTWVINVYPFYLAEVNRVD